MSEPREVQCPTCGGNDVSSSAHGIARCNQCGADFLVQTDEPAETDSAGVLAYRAPGAQHADEAELSELQIRYVSNLRRGAYRERSYWIIGAALCLLIVHLDETLATSAMPGSKLTIGYGGIDAEPARPLPDMPKVPRGQAYEWRAHPADGSIDE